MALVLFGTPSKAVLAWEVTEALATVSLFYCDFAGVVDVIAHRAIPKYSFWYVVVVLDGADTCAFDRVKVANEQ